jgi:hypothetical protein
MPLSRMFNAGVQMNLASLYPKVVFPVPRGTHMIGPLIQWDHSVEWTVPKLAFKTRKVLSSHFSTVHSRRAMYTVLGIVIHITFYVPHFC